MSILVLALLSCAGGVPVMTVPMEDISGAEGLFNLIYYVGTERGDTRHAVVLDLLGDTYEFIPAVRDFEYEILQDISVGEAIYETQVFFSHYAYHAGPIFESIVDGKGNIIGYEIRPTYHPGMYDDPDPLSISYELTKEGKVHVDIKIRGGLHRIFKGK